MERGAFVAAPLLMICIVANGYRLPHACSAGGVLPVI
jgi:hypothetical protein